MKARLILASALLAASAQAMAQSSGTFSGTVVDENGEPVIGAQVKVKGVKQGVVTDLDGKFTLPTGVKRGTEIVVTYVGMESQTAKAQAGMRISLHSTQQQLDDVLVVAFGQQKKSSFTGSAGVVKSDILEKKQLTNVFSGLQGEVAGVQMTNTSGSPTATPSFAIRGFGSINAGTSPLIIVDGAPYDGGWNNLNPNDVANITVLKDAASVLRSITTASPIPHNTMRPTTVHYIIIMFATRACRLLMPMPMPTTPLDSPATRADWATLYIQCPTASISSAPTAA